MIKLTLETGPRGKSDMWVNPDHIVMVLSTGSKSPKTSRIFLSVEKPMNMFVVLGDADAIAAEILSLQRR
jgi:hypothetical protein